MCNLLGVFSTVSYQCINFKESQDTWPVQINFSHKCFSNNNGSLRHVSSLGQRLAQFSSELSRWIQRPVPCYSARRRVDARKPKVQVDLGWYTLSSNVITNGCRNEYKHFRFILFGNSTTLSAPLQIWEFTTLIPLFVSPANKRKVHFAEYSLSIFHDEIAIKFNRD